ncbi:MAG: ACP S-malonyltransferase [Candidatus Dormibacteraeota bacterium]|nr:ACP S-malonyltransferase [Candidatus Dormibacteraeota bacterium]
MTVAFIFPGQGSQHAGMGAGLVADVEIAELCESCSAAAGVDLRRLLVDADDEELKETANAQPALVFMGLALARLLARRGIRPAAAAGHSVGEYAALCVAGALSAEDAVRAVRQRGRAMKEAAPPGTSSMLAVLGLPEQSLEAALIGIPSVWPANYNTPTQTVVGGTMAGLDRAAQRLREAGARRLVPLNVAAAFHTPLVEQAGTSLRGLLETLEWRATRIPVVANLSAEPYEDPTSIAAGLERQVSSPVRWGASVLRLSRLGCETFYELGPKRALSGMMRELVPNASAQPVSSPEAAEQVH